MAGRDDSFERHAFLLELADALRTLSDPVQIQAVAARLLAQHLELERVYFSELDYSGEVAVVRAEHLRGGGPSVVGEYAVKDHPEVFRALRRGDPFFVADVRTSPLISDQARAIARGLGVVSFGAVPRLRDDRLLFALNVSGHAPRAWSQGEVSLIAEVADRTWSKYERARAEEAMRESENRSRRQLAELQSIYDSAHVGLCVLDRELRYVRINKRLAEINGLSVTEHLGRRIDEVLPSVAPTLRGWAERIFRTGVGLVDVELSATTPSQPGVKRTFIEQWLPLKDASGEVTGINVVVEEVTERRHATEELRQSLERLRIAKSAADLGIHDYDLRTGRINWDPRMRELWGLGPAVPITMARILGGVHHEDRERVEAAIDRALDPSAGGEYRAEFRVISRADGAERWIAATGHVTFERGEAVRMVGTAQDISARKATENALREADRRKNQFLAVLSHELRNPITPIRNSLYILERTAPGSEKATRALEVITRQTDQLARLVDDLLDVTRIERGKVQLQRQLLELNELVRRTVEDHRAMFERRQVALEVELWPEPVYVDGDRNRLAQAIGNLLQNAAKFTPPGGKTRVAVEAQAAAARALVRVVDTGVGMTPQMLTRLFEPFAQADETLDRNRGGLGLGLALVKGLVELHGGEVSASSGGPGLGADFELRLPLEAPRSAHEPGLSGAASHARRRVLIIEDNADVAESLCEVLTFCDHEVAVAYSGPEGIDRARAFHPDVVLCDIGLPGMNGYEVARALRSDLELQGACLVALSGYAQPEDLRRAADAGFEHHLAKPPSLEKLERLLAEVR